MGKLVGNTATTLIARGTEIIGDIHFAGTLHVEGTLRGNVVAKEGSDAHLDIQEHGIIEGQIHVPTVRIDGRVVGDVVSTKHVELAAKAQIEGNVHYHLIEMVKGSQVNGSLVYVGEGGQKTASVAEAAPSSDD